MTAQMVWILAPRGGTNPGPRCPTPLDERRCPCANPGMDLWMGLLILVLFGVVVGTERQASRGLPLRPGWRSSEGVRLISCAAVAPAMLMFTTGASAWQRGDPTGLLVMIVFGSVFAAIWWFWLDALWAARRRARQA